MPIDALLLGAVMLLALVLYALFGGADFGGGVWHLLARGPRKAEQRELIAHAIGPIWEANHVWLILVVVVLFTGFPAAFAQISISFHEPLVALLIMIVLRGSAFTFRSASGDRKDEARGWGVVFALASVGAPLLLGMTVGALSSGDARVSAGALGLAGPWLTPFSLATGVFTLVLFSYLAAVYLTVDAGASQTLAQDFRMRALITGVLAGALALLTFVLAGDDAPLVRRGLSERLWSWPLHASTALAALLSLTALYTRRFRLARAAAAVQVGLVVLGWGASQYPFLVVPNLTLANASSSPSTQRLLLWALGAGALLLFPSLVLLFRVFRRGTTGAQS